MTDTTVLLPYGDNDIAIVVPQQSLCGILRAADTHSDIDEADAIHQALGNPTGSALLRDKVRSGQKTTIITSDLTRPCPTPLLLLPVLDELNAGGVADADITVVIALGLHRPMTALELAESVGQEAINRVEVVNHDPEDTVHVGTTRFGTPVDLFRAVVEADVRVCLGNVEFHWFAGYSGGAKAVLPGCASERTVTANHAMMAREEARAGRLEGNPVREDLEAGVDLVGVDFILNVIVNSRHRVTAAVAGDVKAAHRKACELVRVRSAVELAKPADIVIVSGGGSPSDVNLYQAQKALDNALGAVRRGGVIIWLAQCREGVGNSVFESWMREAGSATQILDRIQEEFALGGHKAAALANTVQHARVYLVSDLETDMFAGLGVIQVPEAQQALDQALAELGSEASVLVMPQGGSTFPITAQHGSS
jgi:nickel-dependent lactate racemase